MWMQAKLVEQGDKKRNLKNKKGGIGSTIGSARTSAGGGVEDAAAPSKKKALTGKQTGRRADNADELESVIDELRNEIVFKDEEF